MTKSSNWKSSTYSKPKGKGNRFFSNDSSFSRFSFYFFHQYLGNDLLDPSYNLESMNAQLSDGDNSLANQSSHTPINSISLLPPPDQSSTTILPPTNLDELNSSSTSNHPHYRHASITGFSDFSPDNSPKQSYLLAQPPGLLPNPSDSSTSNLSYSRRIPLIPPTEENTTNSIYNTDHVHGMYDNYPNTSLYQTDHSMYDNYPNTSLYQTDDGYDDRSIHWKYHHQQKNSFYPSNQPYPNGPLYASEMSLPGISYHNSNQSHSLYHTDRTGYGESIYQTDHIGYGDSIYQTDHTGYPSGYPSGYSSGYSNYSHLPQYPQSTYRDSLFQSDYHEGYSSNYSTDYSRNPYKPSILPSSTFHSEISSSSHYPIINSNLNLINKVVDEKQLDAIYELHKKGNLEEAIQALLQLKEEMIPTMEVYLEIIRIYIDQGDYHHAEEAIEEALQIFPKDDQLIEKWIRVEERLGNVKKINQGMKYLLDKSSYSVIKNIVETCMNLCKLNHSLQANLYFQAIFNKGLCKQSNLLWNYSIFLYRSISIQQAIDVLKQALQQFPKYGPMWFTLFQYLEQQCIIYWDGKSFTKRIMTCTAFQTFHEAIQSISNELRWKVYYIATQMILRTLTHLRIVLHSNVLIFFFLSLLYRILLFKSIHNTDLFSMI